VKDPVITLENLAGLHEKAAAKLREAAALIRQAAQRRQAAVFHVETSAVFGHKPIIRAVSREDVSGKLTHAKAAAEYIESAGRPVSLKELFHGLLEAGVRVASRGSLAVALSRNPEIVLLKGKGWATHSVLDAVTRRQDPPPSSPAAPE
jgi:hypothetical protein